MSIFVRFSASGTTPEKYDAVLPKIEEAGQWPPEGMEYHCCFKVDGGDINVSEVWDSQEKFEEFGERLMPILEAEGVEAGEPQVLEVHNTVSR